MIFIESSDALLAPRAVFSPRFPLDGIRNPPCSLAPCAQDYGDDDFCHKPSAREIGQGAFLLDEALYRANDGKLVRKPRIMSSIDRMGVWGKTLDSHSRTSSCDAKAKRSKARLAKQKRKKMESDVKIIRYREGGLVVKGKNEAMATSSSKGLMGGDLHTTPVQMRRASSAGWLQMPSSAVGSPGMLCSGSLDSRWLQICASKMSSPGLPYSGNTDSGGLGSEQETQQTKVLSPQCIFQDAAPLGSCSTCQLDDMFELYINSTRCGR